MCACSEIDYIHFVLTVDLWNESGEEEVNLIKNQHDQSNKAQISLSQPAQFPPALQHVYAYGNNPHEPHMAVEGLPTSVGMQYDMLQRSAGYGSLVQTSQGPMHIPQVPAPGGQYGSAIHIQPPPAALTNNAAQAANMYTRNLIGSLSVNATKLKDTEKHEGIWFVLQDLSVRTEGKFR
jgi:hypothetical protein